MNARVGLVVFCVLAASVLALATAASDHRLAAGGDSVVEVEGGADRTTPGGTATPTATPTSTQAPTDDGPTPTRTADGSSGSGDQSTPTSTSDGGEETATPTEMTAPDEPTPTTGPTPTAEPGTETTAASDDSSPMAAEPADDEPAGFVAPPLDSRAWIAVGVVVLLVLAVLTARRYRLE